MKFLNYPQINEFESILQLALRAARCLSLFSPQPQSFRMKRSEMRNPFIVDYERFTSPIIGGKRKKRNTRGFFINQVGIFIVAMCWRNARCGLC